jgi:hypothetical protein
MSVTIKLLLFVPLWVVFAKILENFVDSHFTICASFSQYFLLTTLLPPTHDESVGLKRSASASIRITNDVHQRIDFLAKRHLFDPNYGTKKVCDMCL